MGFACNSQLEVIGKKMKLPPKAGLRGRVNAPEKAKRKKSKTSKKLEPQVGEQRFVSVIVSRKWSLVRTSTAEESGGLSHLRSSRSCSMTCRGRRGRRCITKPSGKAKRLIDDRPVEPRCLNWQLVSH